MGGQAARKKCDCSGKTALYSFITTCAVIYLSIALVGLPTENFKFLSGLRNDTLSFFKIQLQQQGMPRYRMYYRQNFNVAESSNSTAKVDSKSFANSTKHVAPVNKSTSATVGKSTTTVGISTTSVGKSTTTVGISTTTVGKSTTTVGISNTSVGKSTTTVGKSTVTTVSTTSTVPTVSTVPTTTTAEQDIEVEAKSKAAKSDGLIMQYRIQPDTAYNKIMDRSNIPPPVRVGNSLLMTRTYPKTPRKPRCIRCFRYVYNHVLTPNSCDAPGEVKILAVITTVPSARAVRDAMRQTWLSLTRNNTASVRYLFLLGSGWPADQQANVTKESEQYKDILQDDYIDSYFNLSIKALSGFKFGLTTCKRAQFVMRSADDNYVNLPNILQLIKTDKRVYNHMFGPCVPPGSRAFRGTASKWAVTRNEWQPATYPAYCVGTTFLMSHAITRKLFLASENVPYFVMEDVYFGEVAKQYNIPLFNAPGFNLPIPNVQVKAKIPCKIFNNWRSVHNVIPAHQHLLFQYCPQKKTLDP